ncbi:hypothetical protein GCM10011371_12810 [Novosphingobium marinum]|uniref:GT2 family glycosyltransferase n=1 Tax=Novosphingobium marinum TaxID=1514948 RepID=A0A7Z0BTP6_9SPHN|nr:glycosyltransferase [Novosphingobium marinum]NYH95389.1 GT2 family glycosyltransferase [Novosphingobium marinum]GGC26665.1 hypothetical protein GCM10011371_12810 [Novosphingobium marinum]
MSGGYTPITIELSDALDNPDRRYRPDAGDDGIACTVRDEGALVGFSLHPSARMGPAGLRAGDAVDDEVRQAAICNRLRPRVPADIADAHKITVAICSRNRPVWVARLLDSLLPLRREVPCEVLLVDNAPSDDRTKDVAEAREGVRYVREPKAGLDFARNRAVAEASGRILAFLDDDVVADPNYLIGLRRAWLENPDAGAMTGLVMPFAVETPAQVLFEKRGGFRRGFRPLRFGARRFRDQLHPCGAGSFGAGAHMSFDVELVRALGGFDEALDTGRPLPGGGDIDMFYRVLRAGRPLVYEPQCTVYHEHRREMSQLRHQFYTWGLGFMAYIAKSMRTDPEMRGPMWRTVRWWLRYGVRLLRDDITPFGMVLAEFRGGVKGFFGEYDRSARRSERIRREVA